jgi:hypothetical protein
MEKLAKGSTLEPECDFPLAYYRHFLEQIVSRKIVTLTYDDLFAHSPDFDHMSRFPDEYRSWVKRRDPKATYLLIQHDIDNYPDFTKRMVEIEMTFGIRSSVFMFLDRATSSGTDPRYVIDHDFFVEAEGQGYPIGYHQNALSLTRGSLPHAMQRYRSDILSLRRRFKVDYVVPHGGQGVEVDGIMMHNVDIPIPEELRRSLRWVYNRYGVSFDKRWSDGGLRKTRDADRLSNLDLVGCFLDSLKPGSRNFCLIHPQRWGLNVNRKLNPMLEQMDWYQRVCRDFS